MNVVLFCMEGNSDLTVDDNKLMRRQFELRLNGEMDAYQFWIDEMRRRMVWSERDTESETKPIKANVYEICKNRNKCGEDDVYGVYTEFMYVITA